MRRIKTQVAIIGGGPAGMLLAHALDLLGISSVVLESRSKSYVLARIRAGVLEHVAIEYLDELGLTERLRRECFIQDKIHYGFEGKETLVLDLKQHTGKALIAYGQTALTEDLYQAHEIAGRALFDDVDDAKLYDIDSDSPWISFTHAGIKYRLDCDFIAGCDGSHGICRSAIPQAKRREWERVYPFGWLGILARVPPMQEMLYARHSQGFVLTSKRTPTLSRYYVQVPLDTKVEDWPDERFWAALLERLPPEYRAKVTTGPSIEKSIAPLRSFVSEPMCYGRLYLVGDAAHIVPPTGAKGLNLAISDVYYLSRALDSYFNYGSHELLQSYSPTALNRVWSAVNLSWQLTKLLHLFPTEDPFDSRIRENEFDLKLQHEPLRAAMAYEKIGLPY